MRDNEVVARSLAEPAAVAEIFERHVVTIHRYLARRAGTDVADDLTSEMFTVAFGRRGAFDLERENALPWLYGIAGNLLNAHWRGRQRDDALAARLVPALVTPSFEDRAVDAVDARRRAQEVEAVLTELSEQDVTTLLLYAWEDLTYEEVAQALQIPVGTVRSRLNRVRRRFREPERLDLTRAARHQTDPTGGA